MNKTSKRYDYLIVGAGLYGSVCAYELSERGHNCMVIDKRDHIGGNIFTEKIEGINVHKYGAHIFHTSNKEIWQYVQKFADFNRYTNSPLAYYKGKIFNLPFNMNTFYQLWGVSSPKEALEIIERQRAKYAHIKNPKNLEEQALVLAGEDIYRKLIKGYTEKQWGRSARDIPAFIIRRVPFRYTYDNNYFNDLFQGIPIGGYTQIIRKMLKNTKVVLSTDYFNNKYEFDRISKKTIYTGKIDQFYSFKYGQLDYRSLHFEHKLMYCNNYQGNAVINYTDIEVPYTRVIEHKHFEPQSEAKNTYVTHEYPHEYAVEKEPYYPINDYRNQQIYSKYKTIANRESTVTFGGRLAEYKYYDMHNIIETALSRIKEGLH